MMTTNRLLPIILACSLLVPSTTQCMIGGGDGDNNSGWNALLAMLIAAGGTIASKAALDLYNYYLHNPNTPDNELGDLTKATKDFNRLIQAQCYRNNAPEGCKELMEQNFKTILALGKKTEKCAHEGGYSLGAVRNATKNYNELAQMHCDCCKNAKNCNEIEYLNQLAETLCKRCDKLREQETKTNLAFGRAILGERSLPDQTGVKAA